MPQDMSKNAMRWKPGCKRRRPELDAAKYKLTQGTLLAPFDSTVVDVNIEPGEFAQAGQVTITLADLANMQVETTDLSERDVPSIKLVKL